jgi:hypothetical protein
VPTINKLDILPKGVKEKKKIKTDIDLKSMPIALLRPA